MGADNGVMPPRSSFSVRALLVCVIMVFPGVAHAAVGDFVYSNRDGHLIIFRNPEGCYDTSASGEMWNETDSSAEVYALPNCNGELLLVLGPGKRTEVPGFRSVRF
ncbi:hypothetical protein SAMN04487905_107208 [Actinopolyspora xinjiangensis]|uniref:Uncharacterized protein n=1 Tax=Actinopolyspora xinjiangensis TaxID=405564 RepID=A0A1H0UXB3_9ACTN|nr:hypothetical protein [Actinopolyspora xinjiangensis]SDP70780.1 hypothetical protein SAMN04487905_107208 [Actinopolyspora xinjiangensis]